MQTELVEAIKRGNMLEDRCASFEDRLIQVMEEAEAERLKAVDAVRAKYEDTLTQQVQELQRQMQQLQSRSSAGAVEEQVPVPRGSGQTGMSVVVFPPGQFKETTKQNPPTTRSTPITTDGCRSEQSDHKGGGTELFQLVVTTAANAKSQVQCVLNLLRVVCSIQTTNSIVYRVYACTYMYCVCINASDQVTFRRQKYYA